jgi:DNA-binding transcriptional MerR regulator
MSRTYTIRDLTKEFGVTARTLRFYESEGLLAPGRRGQARIFSARDRGRLTLILRGRRVGFSLAEIAEILDLYEKGDGGIAQLEHARTKFIQRIGELERQKKDIDESVAELKLGLESIEIRLGEHEAEARPAPRVFGFGVMPAES